MSRPKLIIPLDPFDKFMEAIGLVALVVLVLLPIFNYNSLPDHIPIHFNAAGIVDGYGDKNGIWALPAVGLVLYLGMTYLNRYPQIFNYPINITTENAKSQYRIATKMIRVLKTIIAIAFAYIVYASIRNAMGHNNGLGAYFLPIFLIMIFGTSTFFIIKIFKSK